MAAPLTAPTSLQDDDGDRPGAIVPFWRRLNNFFLFPLQMEPLIFLLLLSAGSYLLFLPIIGRIFAVFGLALGASRYAFKVAALASRGVLHSRDYTHTLTDPDWKVLPWKFFVVLVIHTLVVGFLASRNEWLGLLGMLASSLAMPATLMVLIQSSSLRAALNPFELLGTMADIGAQYLLLCLFLFLLQAGFPKAVQLLLPITPSWMLLPMLVFCAVYFLWVMAALIGYVMYQHHGALDIDLLREPEDEPEVAAQRPVKTQAQLRDSEIAELVQKGDLQGAIAQAREWARTGHDNVADQRRYHRVLLLDVPTSGRLQLHSQTYLPLLLLRKLGPEALDAHTAVLKVLPEFDAGKPDVTLALAEQAWKRMDAKHTLMLLRAFDRRYPGVVEIPRAYELIIRALKQGQGKGYKAMPVLQAMQRRYPDHPCSQEAAWVMRDEVGTPAA